MWRGVQTALGSCLLVLVTGCAVLNTSGSHQARGYEVSSGPGGAGSAAEVIEARLERVREKISRLEVEQDVLESLAQEMVRGEDPNPVLVRRMNKNAENLASARERESVIQSILADLEGARLGRGSAATETDGSSEYGRSENPHRHSEYSVGEEDRRIVADNGPPAANMEIQSFRAVAEPEPTPEPSEPQAVIVSYGNNEPTNRHRSEEVGQDRYVQESFDVYFEARNKKRAGRLMRLLRAYRIDVQASPIDSRVLLLGTYRSEGNARQRAAEIVRTTGRTPRVGPSSEWVGRQAPVDATQARSEPDAQQRSANRVTAARESSSNAPLGREALRRVSATSGSSSTTGTAKARKMGAGTSDESDSSATHKITQTRFDVVYVLPDSASAKGMARDLERAGVEDFFPVYGSGVNAVYVGSFRRGARAIRRQWQVYRQLRKVVEIKARPEVRRREIEVEGLTS